MNISNICENCYYTKYKNNNVLLSPLLKPFFPSTTAVNTTGFKLYKSGIDLCNVYAPYTTGTRVPTYYSTNIFCPWTLSSCVNYMTVEYGDNSAQLETNANYGTISSYGVPQWSDKSTYNNHFTQTTSLYEPLYIKNDIYMNNKPNV